jgi:hypothetical protein
MSSPRTIYLISYRPTLAQRAHFAVFVPNGQLTNQDNPEQCLGTVIHITGTPMNGYALEFKRNYLPERSRQPKKMYALGQVQGDLVVDPPVNDGRPSNDDTPNGILETIAAQEAVVRRCENFRAPVNDVWFLRPLCDMYQALTGSRLQTGDAKNGQWITSDASSTTISSTKSH